jgi:hypothetical protein
VLEIVQITVVLLPFLAYPVLRGAVPLRIHMPVLLPVQKVQLMLMLSLLWVSIGLLLFIGSDDPLASQLALLVRAGLQVTILLILIWLPLKKLLSKYDRAWIDNVSGYEIWGLAHKESFEIIEDALSGMCIEFESYSDGIYLPEYKVALHTSRKYFRFTGVRFWVEELENKILIEELSRQIESRFGGSLELDPANLWLEMSCPVAAALVYSIFS